MNDWYTDLVLSDDKPNPTLQVRWKCTQEQASAASPFIEHVAKMDSVELIYNGTTGGKHPYTTWFVAKPANPSLGEVMAFVDKGINAYKESTKTDDDSDWVSLV